MNKYLELNKKPPSQYMAVSEGGVARTTFYKTYLYKMGIF